MRGSRPVTLLVIPEEGERTYEYRIPRLYLWGLAAAAAAVLGLLAAGLYSWGRADSLARRVERLERDRAVLAEQVASIAELEEVLDGLKARNDQLRMLTAEAFGLEAPRDAEPGARDAENFISLSHRLRHGELGSVPTLKPVRASAWTLSDEGLLLRAPAGSLVRASAAGRVDQIRFERSPGWLQLRLDHGYGLWTTYAGLGAATVEAGDFVHKGQPLGLTGGAGGEPPGLRFRILENGREITSPHHRIWL